MNRDFASALATGRGDLSPVGALEPAVDAVGGSGGVRKVREIHVGERQVGVDAPHLDRDGPEGPTRLFPEVNHQERVARLSDRDMVDQECECQFLVVSGKFYELM